MTSLNISLPNSMRAWIDQQIARGGYSTASEYVRELIRQAQKREVRERIDASLLAALDSGEATPMTAKDWEELRQGLRDRLANRKAE